MLAALVAVSTLTYATAQDSLDALHQPLDEVLDLYVRDGFVYYNAIRTERRKLDAYVASLDSPRVRDGYDGWPREQQLAFWINAYNAFVLRTVATHYPIRGTSPQYPSRSIRQIPGAFERLPHRAAGRTVTLDGIEKTILPAFREPRAYLALGRGAIGSGRLRSEAYTAGRLEAQLKRVVEEFATKPEYINIDRVGNRVTVTPIIGWHEAEFIAAYASLARPLFEKRSPIEQAIVAFVESNLLPGELEFIDRNEFRLTYHEFDWRLNDLTGGRPDGFGRYRH